MSRLKLTRPLAVFDIESTGTNVYTDRIVELAVVLAKPDAQPEVRKFLVNPGIPIPAATTAIHGITDADVADCPAFKDIAREVIQLIEGADLAGFNCIRFDIPMLAEEFRRAEIPFDPDRYRVVDAQRIFHRREPRDLTAAVSFYCGELHLGAHGAEADALATLRVIEAQLDHYADLPEDVDALHDYCNARPPEWVDRAGKLTWTDGEITLNFGKRKGQLLRQVVADDPGFLKWMLKADFPRDTKDLVQNALDGTWPDPPVKEQS